MPDETIAAVLDRSGNSWTRGRVCSLRHQYDTAIYREGERAERGEVTLDDAAATLVVSQTTIRRFIAEGVLQPANKSAPWIIQRSDFERADIRREADARRSRRAAADDRQLNLFDLSMT
jgi:hypothetical protein